MHLCVHVLVFVFPMYVQERERERERERDRRRVKDRKRLRVREILPSYIKQTQKKSLEAKKIKKNHLKFATKFGLIYFRFQIRIFY